MDQLQADPEVFPQHRRALLPPIIPKPQQLRQNLRLAQQGLQDLHLFLSRV